MMEFQLIMFASENGVDYSMYLMQLFTQGAIFVFTIFVIIRFIIKYIKERKEHAIELEHIV